MMTIIVSLLFPPKIYIRVTENLDIFPFELFLTPRMVQDEKRHSISVDALSPLTQVK